MLLFERNADVVEVEIHCFGNNPTRVCMIEKPGQTGIRRASAQCVCAVLIGHVGWGTSGGYIIGDNDGIGRIPR